MHTSRDLQNTLVNYSSDAFTEMSVEYGGAGLRLGVGWSRNRLEKLE